MLIEEAVIYDKKFVAQVRDAAGPLGTEQIMAVIRIFLSKVDNDVLVDADSVLDASDLDQGDWGFCESCQKIGEAHQLTSAGEDGGYLCKACVEEEDKAQVGHSDLFTSEDV